MAKVADLKNHARDLERQGQFAKALAIYRHVIKHLEGTSYILRELPLYVKTGDLALKLDDAPEAISSYERAAEHYATHGSVNSVNALCQKILRIAPERKGVHAGFARVMLDHGHVAGARDVMIAYAESAQLSHALETLRSLSERSEEEAKRALTVLVDAAEGGQGSDVERTSKELPLMFSATAEMAARMSASSVTREDEPPIAPAEPTQPLQPEPVGELSASAPTAFGEGTPADDDPSIPKLDASSVRSAQVPTPRHPMRGVLGGAPSARAERQAESGRRFTAAAIGILSLMGVGVLAVTGIIPLPDALRFGSAPDQGDAVSSLSDDLQEARGPGAPDSNLLAAAADSLTGAAGDSAGVVAVADTAQRLPASSIDSPPSGDTTRIAGEPAVADPDSFPAPSEAMRGDSASSGEPILAVSGLPVDSVVPYAADGVVGYLVHQTVGTGDGLALAVLPLASDATDTVGLGPIVVTTLVGDTAIGTMRFGRYRVSATGAVATAVLDSLMRRIVERGR